MNLLVSDILKMAEKQLTDAGIENAKGEAEQMYCHLKNINRTQFFQRWSKPAGDIEMENYFEIIRKRASRKPMQHILGTTEFMGLPFKVREGVLIPRMDTEAVVMEALKVIEHKDSILDLCCGSGIIGISLGKCSMSEGKNIKITAVDISDKAIDLTKENSKLNGIKVDTLKGDLFSGLKNKKYNVIVSNPPYIKREIIPTLDIEVREHDPILALDGGESGLEFYDKIVQKASSHLKKGGHLIFEIGHDQGIEVAELIKNSGFFEDIEITKDMVGCDRVVKGRLKAEK